MGSFHIKKNWIKKRLEEKGDVEEATLQPGMEWAIGAFHRLLFWEGCAATSFLVLPQVPQREPIVGPEGAEARRLIQEAQDPHASAISLKEITNRLHEGWPLTV